MHVTHGKIGYLLSKEEKEEGEREEEEDLAKEKEWVRAGCRRHPGRVRPVKAQSSQERPGLQG